jgi:voltage-gated potassium channel
VTATTVGYGDHFPVSAEGRGVAVVLLLVGVGLLSVVTANIAAYLVEVEAADEGKHAELMARLDRLEEMLAAREQR